MKTIIKSITKLYYKLTDENYDKKVRSATNTLTMLQSTTKVGINHFYNMKGEKIRGYSNPPIKFKENLIHPLVAKYK